MKFYDIYHTNKGQLHFCLVNRRLELSLKERTENTEQILQTENTEQRTQNREHRTENTENRTQNKLAPLKSVWLIMYFF